MRTELPSGAALFALCLYQIAYCRTALLSLPIASVMSQAAVNEYVPPETPMTVASVPKHRQKLTVSATYTAEPVGDFLSYWLELLGLAWDVEFAAYQQVFQELLDPGSLMARNRDGVPVLLVRVEDFLRHSAQGAGAVQTDSGLQAVVEELTSAVEAFAGPRTRPLLVVVHDPSPHLDAGRFEACTESTSLLRARLRTMPNVVLVTDSDWRRDDFGRVFDEEQNALGHIPYTTEVFAALATTLMRKVHMLTSTPRKVLVLDCDNTLWGGVVGEDGPLGLTLAPSHLAMQRFAVARAEQGVVVVLCSKNVEADVDAAFDERKDFPLTKKHIVTQRVNWLPKSENIRAIAAELNLGLDSFVFIDDNPVECAEVQSALPMVLTLRFPTDGTAAQQLLENLWAFDRISVTAEDKQRTEAYKKNAERKRFQEQSGSLSDFISGLNLQIQIDSVSAETIPRVAQLTQRTNQFNTTTLRRTEAEVTALEHAGTHCFCVRVSDRFGDYGLVGVMTCRAADVLEVDSLMLSCRVLGRGVEHAMVRYLGELARARGVQAVVLPVVTSARNQPVLTFLDSVASEFRESTERGWLYTLPTEFAAAVSYAPTSFEELEPAEAKPEAQKPAISALPSGGDLSALHAKITSELATTAGVVAAVTARQHRTRTWSTAVVPPANEVEHAMRDVWQECLQLEELGVEDNYFELGGTSVLAVRLLAEVKRQLGVALPLSSLIEAPTVRLLSRRINPAWQRSALVLLRPGNLVGPHFFFVHDGLGETLLYANVARQLPVGMAAFGLEPTARFGIPLAHTTIEEIAAEYVRVMREAQPKGPYFIGGLCAGGTIALEMARQLSGSGERVALVAMFDNAAPGAQKRRGRVGRERVERFASLFRKEETLSLRGALRLARRASDKVLHAASYELSTRFDQRRGQVMHWALSAFVRQEMTWPTWLKQWSVQELYDRAEAMYRPSPCAPADRIVLFRASEGQGIDTPYKHIFEGDDLGWRALICCSLAIVDVAGGHGSMLQEPNGRELGVRLARFVAELR